jgi:hypothetical protein
MTTDEQVLKAVEAVRVARRESSHASVAEAELREQLQAASKASAAAYEKLRAAQQRLNELVQKEA